MLKRKYLAKCLYNRQQTLLSDADLNYIQVFLQAHKKACPFSDKGMTKFQMSKFKGCTHRYCFDLIKETTV